LLGSVLVMLVVVRATTMPGASGRRVGNSASGELLVSRAAQAVRPVAGRVMSAASLAELLVEYDRA
jgi:hypothetical protein